MNKSPQQKEINRIMNMRLDLMQRIHYKNFDVIFDEMEEKMTVDKNQGMVEGYEGCQIEKPCKAEKKSEIILRFLDQCNKEAIALDVVAWKINGVFFGEAAMKDQEQSGEREAGLIAKIIYSLQTLRSRLEETRKLLEEMYKEL
jgi:Mg2+ and Co2+ transporter CorA